MNRKSFVMVTAGLVVIELMVHFLTATNYELHRDEMLYFSIGSHLSWGYASTPPFMALLSYLIRNLFGYQEFFVKLFPALAGGGIIVLTALFVKEIGGKLFAVLAGGVAYLISIAMLRSASLFMPVIFELFFWMLFLFFVLKLVNRKDPRYWVAIGVIFGLAFLNKYSVLLLGFSTFVAILISEHRKLIWSKYLVYGMIAGLLIMLPNLSWQFNHRFPVLTHMSELYRTQLDHVSKASFLAEQIMMNFTSILIWMTGLIALIFSKSGKKFRVFLYIYLLVVLLFMVLKGKPYYTLGVYPMLFAWGGFYLEKVFQKRSVMAGYALLVFAVISTIPLVPLGLPVLSQQKMGKYCAAFSAHISPAPMRNEQNGFYPIPQDYMDMTGWKELAGLAATAYARLDSSQKKDCIVFANNYGQAGALDFYGKKYHLPASVCLNDSYIFWAPDSLTAQNFIISDKGLGDIPRLFENYLEIGTIHNTYFRENGLQVFLCQNPKPPFNEFVKKIIRTNKQIYGF